MKGGWNLAILEKLPSKSPALLGLKGTWQVLFSTHSVSAMLSSLVNTSQANLTLSNSIDLEGQTKNNFLTRSCQQQKIVHFTSS